MLKKRSKAISMLIVLAFLFTMILPGMAFGADPAKITYSTKAGVDASTTAQDLGFVKVSDMDAATSVYVEVSLPSDVDWETAINATGADAADYITMNDSAPDTILSGADEDEYVAVFSSIDDADIIKILFNDVIVKKSAADDINATVTVKGVENGQKIWEYSKECLIGQQGDAEVTMTAADPKSISVGDAQKLAKVTLTENVAGALKDGDQFIFTLPKNFKWDYTNTTVKDGKYGLTASIIGTDSDELTVEIDTSSVTFEDKLEITGYVVVYPNAAEGDLEVDVEAVCDSADFDDASVVLGTVGDSTINLEVEDTCEDTIYPAAFDKGIDQVTMEATGSFTEGDQFTISLSDGAIWYEDETSFETAVPELNVLGFYDDNQSVWVEVALAGDGDTEIELDGLKIATLPDAPAGDIVFTVDGDFSGDAVVGEIIARAEVTADAPVVELASLGVAAGDITIVEAKKGSIADGAVITLKLPTGVFFAGKPTVEINGDEVSSSNVALADEDSDCNITLDGMRSNKVDTIVISDIEYDLDTRVRGTDVNVKISGLAVNTLADLVADCALVPEDFEDDYADDAVFTVVNATTQAEGTADSLFTIGSTTYSINGVEYTLDVAPYIAGDRTYLPVRFVAYAMGVSEANILWDGAAQTVTLLKGDKVVQLKVGSTTLLINGAAVTMDVAPQITADRVCLPIRFVAQAFGAVVGWDAATQQVSIDM